MISDLIEKSLSKFLQSRIAFEVNNRAIKRGRLILTAVKDFHLFFIIQTDSGDTKQFILPLPFAISEVDNCVTSLDYTLETLSHKNKDILFKLKTINKKKTTRFFDTLVYIRRLE